MVGTGLAEIVRSRWPAGERAVNSRRAGRLAADARRQTRRMDTNGDTPVPEARRSYHEHLEEIRADVVKLAAKACEQIGAATQAILDSDLPLVDRIYAEHEEIAARGHARRAPRVPAVRAPAADGVRPARSCSRCCGSCTRSSSRPG